MLPSVLLFLISLIIFLIEEKFFETEFYYIAQVDQKFMSLLIQLPGC
jgi:Gpi18-like mannosyltransferase